MKKVLITGAAGLVGSRFVELYSQDFEFLTPTQEELDITNIEGVAKYFTEHDFDSVVNFAAITDVKKAEMEKGDRSGLTWQVNVAGVLNLVEACNDHNKFLVQISTDLVFKGTKTPQEKITEDAPLAADSGDLSWYGWTKLEAERLITSKSKRYAVARIAYPYRAKYELKKDFAQTFVSLYKDGNLYPLFTDNMINPTFIDEASLALSKILNDDLSGIFHLVSQNSTCHYDFAKYLLEGLRFDTHGVVRTLMSDYIKKSAIPRALYSNLSCEETQKKLGMVFMTWQEGIDSLLKQLK